MLELSSVVSTIDQFSHVNKQNCPLIVYFLSNCRIFDFSFFTFNITHQFVEISPCCIYKFTSFLYFRQDINFSTNKLILKKISILSKIKKCSVIRRFHRLFFCAVLYWQPLKMLQVSFSPSISIFKRKKKRFQRSVRMARSSAIALQYVQNQLVIPSIR